MFNNALGRFRLVGLLDGSSLLLLVFIAMPLKYFFDFPEAVRIMGSIHGFIFLIYCLGVVYAVIAVKWPFRYTIGAFLAAVIPFGNFILDGRLKKLKANFVNH
ncbi:DUF3817 domain-containing protein [Bacillus mojavensis]|jgi:integral membrane protein|uniref:DUF3817 domain-containing protein n=1 Tax=Bacillus mojavensis TaxID=72360 RepID=UPI00256ED02B|nr:DUF3817 domain-containing protein [Bacillus mojavensis]